MTDSIMPRDGGHHPYTSLSLLEQAVAGDRESWEQLWYLYAPLVDRWCRRRHLSAFEIEEVGQRVFLTLYRNLGKFHKEKPGDSFRKWLRTLTENKVNDYLKEELRSPRAAGGSEARGVLEAHPFRSRAPRSSPDDDETERKLLLRLCLEMVQSEFEARSFAAFRGVVLDGLPPGEVARSLGMKSVGAVYTAKSRVTKRLRELLEKVGEDELGP